jgi:hypothetical protein
MNHDFFFFFFFFWSCSTRPFLSLTEKKWIAFQLLTAMANSWNRGVSVQISPHIWQIN